MKNIYLIVILLLSSIYSISQVKEASIALYATPSDFVHNRKANVKAIAIIKDESDQHLSLKSIIDSSSRKNIKKVFTAWGLEYNGNKYFNLQHSSDLFHPQVFIKLDIVGRYSVAFIDDNSPKILRSRESTYYGVGLAGAVTGVLVNESYKWNKNWFDKNGKQKKIIFIDNYEFNPKAIGSYLSRVQLKKLLPSTDFETRVKEIPFEEIVEIIKSHNELEAAQP
ncbi:MAG TPA: hypothetical protein VGB63_07940 [Pedobacter sp.]|jgi:hypothetical protein